MSQFLLPTFLIVLAYLIGAIPFGYMVARLHGVRVTKVGSGRIGGTNVLRAAGPLAAGLTVLGDVLKGLIPIYLMIAIGIAPLVIALAGTAAVIGHNYSIFLGFRGGAGAGTAAGVLGGMSLGIGVTAALLGIMVLWFTGYASLLTTTISVTGLGLLAGAALLGYLPYEYIVFGTLTTAIILYGLRRNYARLLAGTERKVVRNSNHVARP